jgi:membrane protein
MEGKNNDMKQRIWKRMTDTRSTPFRVLKLAINGFTEARSTESAAGTAFFTLFSLFPMLIFVVAVGSFFVDEEMIKEEIVILIPQIIPVSPSLIEDNVVEVLRLRGEATLISVIGLAWSATGAFNLLSRNINRAFPYATSRGFVGSRLIAFAMLVFLIGLLALSSIAVAALNLVLQHSVSLFGREILAEVPFETLLKHSLSLAIGFIIFTNLYRWIPATRVPWKAALLSALVISIAWDVTTTGFSWYLRSGLAEYRLVYGSLGAVVVLMFWIYLNFIIIYFGAHLAAGITTHLETKTKGAVNS